jgi:hypothetical protein
MRHPKAHLPQLARSSRKSGLSSPEALLPCQRPPRRKAANQALATRENQGNLAPVKTGAVFLDGASQFAPARTQLNGSCLKGRHARYNVCYNCKNGAQ